MDRQEAAALLGVDPKAGAAEVRRRYQELYSDYQIRLTNAPTPALRTTYQKKLQQLEEASKLLLEGMEVDPHADLPSASPVLERLDEEPDRAKTAPAAAADEARSRPAWRMPAIMGIAARRGSTTRRRTSPSNCTG